MEKENELRIKGKMNFFFEEKVRVHVERVDRQFWNGTIVGKKSDSVFLFNDDKLGVMHLFIYDIYDVEEYRRAGV